MDEPGESGDPAEALDTESIAEEEWEIPELDKENPPESETEEEGEWETEIDVDGAEAEADIEREPFYPPDEWGPYAVGEMDFTWRDFTRGGILGKDVSTKVWYPAITPPMGTSRVRYMALIEGLAYANILPERNGAPYPLVLFSHGNKGINFQSFTFTTHLASFGFIVAAPNHSGNTMFDDPSDEEMAQITLDRPLDMEFVREKIAEANEDPTNQLYQMVDMNRVGISGHSFGGYTTLVLAGATVNVEEAEARCEAGTEADIFCPYIGYFPPGQILSRPSQCDGLMVAVAMAPGGYAAFGENGLANISMPVMVMGGTLDEFLRPELRPLYSAAPIPKVKVEIEGMGHMGFTDICRIPAVDLIPTLGDMCDSDTFIDVDRGWEIINPFAIAFIRRHLKGEIAMEVYLTPEYATFFPEVTFDASLNEEL